MRKKLTKPPSPRIVATLPFILPERAAVTQIRKPSLRPAPARPKQQLPGFEERFTDIVDYIITITNEIWADRAVGRIYETYDHACAVFSAYGIVRSVEEVLANTIDTMNGFTESEIEHVNIAWCEEADGFYTSHLGHSRSTNTGRSLAGPATGRPVSLHFAADCVSFENRIHTEWLVRDTGALIRQLGLDMHAIACSFGPPLECFIVSPENRLIGQVPRQVLDVPVTNLDGWARHLFQNLWNLKRLDWLDRYYSPDVVVHAGGARNITGMRALGTLILAIQAAIPDGVMRVEHVCHSEESDGVIVAVRWILEGTCRRGELLGDVPDGKPVFMMGISHLRFTGGLICEEWMLFDELAILVQALRD